jgi:hypothetical protein
MTDDPIQLPWEVGTDSWHERNRPWTDAVAIVTIDDEALAPAIVLWLTRGWGNELGAKHICDLHNTWLKTQQETGSLT